MTNLRAAHWYARHLGPVLPLEPGDKQPLAALAPHGSHDATRDAPTIEAWWRRRPDANLGVRCDDLLVVDLDTRNDGEARWVEIARGREVPTTPVQRTATGGVHLVFRRPVGELRGKLAQGVDLLHGFRYFVACPSTRPQGAYRWEVSPRVVPVASCPGWLAELARKPSAPPARPVVIPPDAGDRVDRARKYLEHTPPAISGGGGHVHTFLVAQRLVRGFALSEGQAFDLLCAWNETCQPPWSERELRRKVRQAAAVGTMEIGAMLGRDAA